jgi:hypothetical protein
MFDAFRAGGTPAAFTAVWWGVKMGNAKRRDMADGIEGAAGRRIPEFRLQDS